MIDWLNGLQNLSNPEVSTAEPVSSVRRWLEVVRVSGLLLVLLLILLCSRWKDENKGEDFAPETALRSERFQVPTWTSGGREGTLNTYSSCAVFLCPQLFSFRPAFCICWFVHFFSAVHVQSSFLFSFLWPLLAHIYLVRSWVSSLGILCKKCIVGGGSNKGEEVTKQKILKIYYI